MSQLGRTVSTGAGGVPRHSPPGLHPDRRAFADALGLPEVTCGDVALILPIALSYFIVALAQSAVTVISLPANFDRF